MHSKSKESRFTIVQGPYLFGATLGRYQDVPPSFHTVSGSLTSDPIITLLHVYPRFPSNQLGTAMDKLSDMLAGNLILSIHIRDDWIREEGAHPPRLSIAFTMTGPAMTEAVRSMMQSEIREILDDHMATIVLPNATPYPQPWNRVVELPTPSRDQTTRGTTPDHLNLGDDSTEARTKNVSSVWNAVSRSLSKGPLVTQTYDISGMQDLPGTLSRMNTRMDELEESARANQAKQESQFGQVFSLLTTLTQSVQSLVVATQAPSGDRPP